MRFYVLTPKKVLMLPKPFTLYFISRFLCSPTGSSHRPHHTTSTKTCNVNSDSCGHEQLYKLLHFLTLCKQGRGLTFSPRKYNNRKKLNKIFPFSLKKRKYSVFTMTMTMVLLKSHTLFNQKQFFFPLSLRNFVVSVLYYKTPCYSATSARENDDDADDSGCDLEICFASSLSLSLCVC